MAETTATERNARKTREGVVVSNKMNKTAVIAVVERVKHKKYDKFVLRTKKLYAHDEANDVQVGDRVRAGQLIALLETPELQDEIRQSEAASRRSQ